MEVEERSAKARRTPNRPSPGLGGGADRPSSPVKDFGGPHHGEKRSGKDFGRHRSPQATAQSPASASSGASHSQPHSRTGKYSRPSELTDGDILYITRHLFKMQATELEVDDEDTGYATGAPFVLRPGLPPRLQPGAPRGRAAWPGRLPWGP